MLPGNQRTDYKVYDSEGLLPKEDIDRVVTVYDEWSAAATKACFGQDHDVSVAQALNMSPQQPSSELTRRQKAFLRVKMALDIGTDEASALANLSCRQRFGNDTYYEFGDYDGKDTVVVGGYAKLIDSLATGIDTRLNTPVREVHHGSSGDTVSIETMNGQTIEAPLVVVTTGLGAILRPSR